MSEPSLISTFDAVLADLDGVVYAGADAIPGAVDALKRLSTIDVGLGYVTNNASRSPAQVAQHLRDLGAPATPEQVVSSAQAGAQLLAQRFPAGSKVLITGSPALAEEVQLVGMVPVHSAEDGVAVVIQGFEPSLTWKDLAEASYAVAAGAEWVATNTDMTIPRERGIAPGNGTFVAAVTAATGKQPVVAGKPEAALFKLAAERLNSSRPLVVGDRLDTDILGGNNAGMATAVVLTGVDTRESVLAARAPERPGYLLGTLAELYEPYPEVTMRDGGFSCGGAHAAVMDNELRVTGLRSDLNGWRAACAAWWEAEPDAAEAAMPAIHFAGESKAGDGTGN
ncbi:HAD-IIA family hydrolase [Paenarthrobacter sp. Z7-10]|uniref:HAD-IIA family hydrolase n=1 Tax=Paenarthrobacter sp. Z7-10 TaxID=2787635 RepID=UPI0022A943FB|nr:HAD-IIA family hydrolase [Paenarthrobacter sp. Z7-10]MCZ2403520.1 HAD-IIA family hydrolase [Paenarthrobacter sp. Z7-10]